ncbi:hypothetical protein PoMZ_10031 [Pyricularia oryzae]|uniref:Uncharacterized protein n=1 Tax=Pyricularia oryzae TaxID=318829 RepID=A0A4V1C4W8_PYROR|nr:hypothetical protein PoMZ_10031 [Pyricularia oryzae]
MHWIAAPTPWWMADSPLPALSAPLSGLFSIFQAAITSVATGLPCERLNGTGTKSRPTSGTPTDDWTSLTYQQALGQVPANITAVAVYAEPINETFAVPDYQYLLQYNTMKTFEKMEIYHEKYAYAPAI